MLTWVDTGENASRKQLSISMPGTGYCVGCRFNKCFVFLSHGQRFAVLAKSCYCLTIFIIFHYEGRGKSLEAYVQKWKKRSEIVWLV